MLVFEKFELAPGVLLDAPIRRGVVHALVLESDDLCEDFIARYLADLSGRSGGGEILLEEVGDAAGRPRRLRELREDRVRGFFAQFAIDPETFFVSYPELHLVEGSYDEFAKTRTACIVGRDTAAKYGWRVGQTVPIAGTIFTRTDASMDFFDAQIERAGKADIVPRLECVEETASGLVAHFGYQNDNGVTVKIPYGSKNDFDRDRAHARPDHVPPALTGAMTSGRTMRPEP